MIIILKNGELVVMHTCMESEFYNGVIWRCSCDEFKSSSGQNVIFLEGFSGYFMVDYLQRVNIEDYVNKTLIK